MLWACCYNCQVVGCLGIFGEELFQYKLEDMLQSLAMLSVVFFLFAAPPYIIDTLKGKTKPERATWFVFSVLGIIAFISQVKLGAAWSLVFSGFDTFGSLIVFVLSIKHGVGGWTLLDRIALVVAGAGVVVALAAHEPVVALLGDILADIAGTVLTVYKTFQAPDTETTISWLLVGTGALTGVLAVGSFNVALLLYPAYLMLANYAVPITQVAGRAYWRARGANKTLA